MRNVIIIHTSQEKGRN